jgi:hypothetical protein
LVALGVFCFPAEEFHPIRRVTDIVLIAQPVVIQPAPLLEPIPDGEPDLDVADTPPAADAEDPPAVTRPPSPASLPPVSARSAPADADATSTSVDAFPLSPGTRSVLQRLQCPGDPETFARTGLCPHGARASSQMAAAAPAASDYIGIDTAALLAEFGIAPHALSGQPTLDSGTRNRAFSNSDSIRDALPASRRDPAFGD